jgi:hypothetical protein
MWPENERRAEPRPYGYDLYDDGRAIGRLEWRLRPRSALGWSLTRPPAPAQRLSVDVAIDELARDERSPAHVWDLHAELAAILSTATALDAAGRALYPWRDRPGPRFRRGIAPGAYEIHVTDVDALILGRATPELALDAVSDVVILAGEVTPGALEGALRRVRLLGGRVVAIFKTDDAF